MVRPGPVETRCAVFIPHGGDSKAQSSSRKKVRCILCERRAVFLRSRCDEGKVAHFQPDEIIGTFLIAAALAVH